MIANKANVKVNALSINIDPVFKDPEYNVIKWDQAVTNYQARATWSQVENAESYGIFTVKPDGRAFFSPSNAGQFKVGCSVQYLDSVTNSWKLVNQDLTITVTKDGDECECVCEVEISSKEGNIITKQTDGLFAPTQDGETIFRNAGVIMSALTAVYERDGKIYPLDYRDGENISLLAGITISSGDIGRSIQVRTQGFLDDDNFNWSAGRVYLGIEGRLTQVPPKDGYMVVFGSAVSNKRLNINIQDVIKLE